jgi:hypothetical protein
MAKRMVTIAEARATKERPKTKITNWEKTKQIPASSRSTVTVMSSTPPGRLFPKEKAYLANLWHMIPIVLLL